MGFDSTLPLEEPHDVGHRMFGWDTEHHVHVIGTGVALKHFYFFLFCQFPDDFADLDSDWTVEPVFPIFWYNDHVVFAVPHHMAL